MPRRTKILIVEDEVVTVMALRMQFEKLGYEVLPAATSYDSAVKIFKNEKPDVILSDIMLEDSKDGIEFILYLRKRSDVPVIYMTGYDSIDIKKRAEKTKPLAYLIKPVNAKTVSEIIRSAFV